MDFDILEMVASQSDRFAELVPDWSALGFVYGWVYVFSLLTAVITLIFVVFRRESGAVSASLIVQWVGVWAIPLIVSSFLALGGDDATAETFRMITASFM